MAVKDSIEKALIQARDSMVLFLCRRGVRPNHLTVFGLIFSSASAIGFALDRHRLGGILLLVAGALDMMDGRVAREGGQATRFGAFFDSVVDRYSDTVIFLGITAYYLNKGMDAFAFLALVAMVGALITSYSRARGESLVSNCDVGYLQRPERIVLLIIGGLTGKLDLTIWVLAVLSHVTVLQRIVTVFRKTVEEAAQNSLMEDEPSAVEESSPANRERGGKATALDLIYWSYSRNSWQYLLLSGIVMVIIFLPDLLGLFR
jgi:CDP-diacylglycerol--glycerol-3-phosphate 3-phosphatidyltransferase